MKERPILFSAPMVQAILEGRKTQTRRALKLPHGYWETCGNGELIPIPMNCPYGHPGNHLWVRENFSGPHSAEGSPPSMWAQESPIWYWADGEPDRGDWTKAKPSIHLPRIFARILLEVTNIRVERLNDITETDAKAEGFCDTKTEYPEKPAPHFGEGWTTSGVLYSSASGNFQILWEKINGVYSWLDNPWVWVIEFKRVPS